MLFDERQLEAKIRQRIDLFGHQLSGPGTYAQLGGGSGKVKLELKLSLGGQVASFQQICDGRFLYTRQELPQRKRLSFVDLRRVRETAAASGRALPFDGASSWLALGGLPGLLWQLDEHFRFGAAAPGQIGGGKVPVWVVRGTWKREKVARLLPAQRKGTVADRSVSVDQLPPHLPHLVEVTLGGDQLFPLFPYRIVYFRRELSGRSAAGSSRASALRPILVLELFNVHYRRDMSPSEFQYQPDDEELIDQTDRFLKTRGLASPP